LSLDDADRALRAGPLADLGKLLKPGGLRELEAAIARETARGLKAHVLIMAPGTDLGPYRALWERLGYQPAQDLLLLFNGRHWEARGWSLTVPQIDGALAASEPALRAYYGRGLATAVTNLARAARKDEGEEPAPRQRSSALPIIIGVGGTTTLGVIGWAVVRRNRLARERRQALKEARSSADQVFADVLLAAEEMSGPEAVELREKATRLRDQIDALAPPDLKQLPAKEESLTMAQLRQMENELEALRSTVLQVKRRP
jgi:hypothetical protein